MGTAFCTICILTNRSDETFVIRHIFDMTHLIRVKAYYPLLTDLSQNNESMAAAVISHASKVNNSPC